MTREKVKAFSEWGTVLVPGLGRAVAILQRLPVKCLHMARKKLLLQSWVSILLSTVQRYHRLHVQVHKPDKKQPRDRVNEAGRENKIRHGLFFL